MKMPLWPTRSLAQPRATVHTQATRYGGTDLSCASVDVQPNASKMLGTKAPKPWTAALEQKNVHAQTCV